jgi:predicted ATP-binding protein involved in virulence
MGTYEKAEPLYLKALKISEKVLGEEHPNTATSYNNLAGLYESIGAYKKAEPLYLKALKIREKVLGEEHPSTAGSYNDLAVLYRSMGAYEKAEPLYLKALKISEKVLDEEHPNTITITKNFDNFMEKYNKLFFLNSEYSNLTFKIDNIKIKNFKQYKAPFSMKFSDQINIIIGQNATGKTTLLQAIALGLLKEGILDARELDYDKYISKNENEAEIIIGHNSSQKVVKIKKDGREIKNNYFIPFVLAYGSNFFTKYNLSADKIVDDILNETIHKKIANSIFQDYVDEFWNPLTVLNELDRSDHKKAKEKRDDIFNTINSFLEGYRLVHEKNRYFFKKDDDETELYLEDLSEGYRGSVLLITDMLIKILGVGWTPIKIEGIVLIDEFDKHLHPRWQSRLVNQLTTTFPKIQFIMTTHNPMSILDRDASQITILKEVDGEIKAVRGRGTKNIGVSVVLLKYFNVDSTVGNTMSENINNFNRLKLKKELTSTEEEELKKLEKFLGGTVASNVIFDRKYLKFLEFIRDHKDIDFDRYEKIDEEEMSEFLKDFGDFFDD